MVRRAAGRPAAGATGAAAAAPGTAFERRVMAASVPERPVSGNGGPDRRHADGAKPPLAPLSGRARASGDDPGAGHLLLRPHQRRHELRAVAERAREAERLVD